VPRDVWRSLPPGPRRVFFEMIHDLWRRRGMPSGRAIAVGLRRAKAPVQPTQGTVNNLLDGPRLPQWDNVAAVIRYLGARPVDYLPLWRAAKAPPEDHRGRLDLTPVGSELELKSLIRSRGYTSHSTLLIRAPVAGQGDDEWQWAEIEDVLKLVSAAIRCLDNKDHASIARCLFGIDAGWRDMTLSQRREEVAEILHRSPRTIQRMQAGLIAEVASALTTMLTTLSRDELQEIINQQDIITSAEADATDKVMRDRLAALKAHYAGPSPATAAERGSLS
jgi:hypothetical protein